MATVRSQSPCVTYATYGTFSWWIRGRVTRRGTYRLCPIARRPVGPITLSRTVALESPAVGLAGRVRDGDLQHAGKMQKLPHIVKTAPFLLECADRAGAEARLTCQPLLARAPPSAGTGRPRRALASSRPMAAAGPGLMAPAPA